MVVATAVAIAVAVLLLMFCLDYSVSSKSVFCVFLSVAAGLREIHISGDIAYATRQYWYATQDMDWLTAVGSDLVSGIADFYLSRSTVNANGGLSINDVIPPDE